jgi:RNA polymerase sigma-70 factor (ECF subfamily)
VDQLSDHDLLALLHQGEMAALRVLVERYHDPLRGYLFRLLGGDRPLAEDLAQEAFLRVLRHGHHGQEAQQPAVRSFKAWLFAIATNLARDELKSAARRTCVALEGPEGPEGPVDDLYALPDPAPGPEEQALAREHDTLLIAALDRLTVEYRTTLLLRLYNDLSLSEIAGVLRIPVGTVKSRLSTGLRQLRGALAALREQEEEVMVHDEAPRMGRARTVPR